jgi:hypothetical protein
VTYKPGFFGYKSGLFGYILSLLCTQTATRIALGSFDKHWVSSDTLDLFGNTLDHCGYTNRGKNATYTLNPKPMQETPAIEHSSRKAAR